ncbi:MAG: hypothetical protein ACTHNN_18685 [Xanthobacteraceae bacterium]
MLGWLGGTWIGSGALRAESTRPPANTGGPATATRSERLRPVSKIRCPPVAEQTDPLTTSALGGAGAFVAHDRFREDVSRRSEVRISWLGAGFGRRYLSKVEPPTEIASLQVFLLDKPSRSIAIADALHHPYETRLADIWCLLKLQPNGEPGALSVNATPNLFFVRDAAGVLGVVDVLWSGAGWEIGASSLTRNRPWLPGRQVITR